MGLSFEVKETDLLGRVGRIVTRGRRLETPCLFPVVHPVSQSVGVEEMREMGFGGLMTNSYILHARRREESLQQGIHRLLGFEGLIMTDSGGYQVLEYGELGVSFAEIAEFQSRIGSDLAVTLDWPTGYSTSRRHARETADHSNSNALATLKQFGDSQTTWVGPVQGGLHEDILRTSARKLIAGGFRYLALGSPVQVMENYRYAELVKMIAATRGKMPYAVPLHLFGAGHPHVMAMAVALGCDTFDSASYMLFARDGRYMTERGSTSLNVMKYLPCSCQVCRGRSSGDLKSMSAGESTPLLARHNLHVLRTEVELCKEAISEGRLWDLVEERAVAHPRLFQAFREFAKLSKLMEPGTAAMKSHGLFLRGDFDEARPELRIASRHLSGAQRRQSRRALLLAAEESIPMAKLHAAKELAQQADYDAYGLHPHLGPYPAELEFVYPLTQTVVATPGMEKRDMDGAVNTLKRMGYRGVLVASVEGTGRIRFGKFRSTRKKEASSPSPRPASSRPRALRRP